MTSSDGISVREWFTGLSPDEQVNIIGMTMYRAAYDFTRAGSDRLAGIGCHPALSIIRLLDDWLFEHGMLFSHNWWVKDIAGVATNTLFFEWSYQSVDVGITSELVYIDLNMDERNEYRF